MRWALLLKSYKAARRAPAMLNVILCTILPVVDRLLHLRCIQSIISYRTCKIWSSIILRIFYETCSIYSQFVLIKELKSVTKVKPSWAFEIFLLFVYLFVDLQKPLPTMFVIDFRTICTYRFSFHWLKSRGTTQRQREIGPPIPTRAARSES